MGTDWLVDPPGVTISAFPTETNAAPVESRPAPPATTTTTAPPATTTTTAPPPTTTTTTPPPPPTSAGAKLGVFVGGPFASKVSSFESMVGAPTGNIVVFEENGAAPEPRVGSHRMVHSPKWPLGVGASTVTTFANQLVASGQADMVAIGRGFLNDPRWPWHAAEALGVTIEVPFPYSRAATRADIPSYAR